MIIFKIYNSSVLGRGGICVWSQFPRRGLPKCIRDLYYVCLNASRNYVVKYFPCPTLFGFDCGLTHKKSQSTGSFTCASMQGGSIQSGFFHYPSQLGFLLHPAAVLAWSKGYSPCIFCHLANELVAYQMICHFIGTSKILQAFVFLVHLGPAWGGVVACLMVEHMLCIQQSQVQSLAKGNLE